MTAAEAAEDVADTDGEGLEEVVKGPGEVARLGLGQSKPAASAALVGDLAVVGAGELGRGMIRRETRRGSGVEEED